MKRICCLCGQDISERKTGLPGSLSMDHAPTKQFYPQAVLRARNLNLWTVPTHKACNNNYQNDEDYFLHRLYPLVANGNPKMAEAILDDIKRRAKKPQSRAFIRDFLKDCTTRTEGGIWLPPPIVKFTVSKPRIHRVAVKIVQGLYFHEFKTFLPRNNFKDLRLCEAPGDAPELFKISWQLSKAADVAKEVFSYRHATVDGACYFSMVFWESFMIGVVFGHPPETKGVSDLGRNR